ncbi:MAG: NfeD family protein [Gammaproteobacteria bacterium]
MNDLLTHLNHWHWFGGALFFLILEIISGSGFLLWSGIAAACVGLLMLAVPALTWPMQWLIFSILTVISGIVWWIYLKKRPIQSTQPNLNRRGEQLVGRRITLTEAIVNGSAIIYVDGIRWKIQGPDLIEGSLVYVVGVEGAILKVAPVDA